MTIKHLLSLPRRTTKRFLLAIRDLCELMFLPSDVYIARVLARIEAEQAKQLTISGSAISTKPVPAHPLIITNQQAAAATLMLAQQTAAASTQMTSNIMMFNAMTIIVR